MLDGRLVVVRDFDFVGINPLPAETDPVLIIDADAVFTASISFKALKSVSRCNRELAQVPDPIKLRQLATDDGHSSVGQAPLARRLSLASFSLR